jgi:hypothetical protein
MVKAGRSETVAKDSDRQTVKTGKSEIVAKLRQADSEIRQIRDSSKT